MTAGSAEQLCLSCIRTILEVIETTVTLQAFLQERTYSNDHQIGFSANNRLIEKVRLNSRKCICWILQSCQIYEYGVRMPLVHHYAYSTRQPAGNCNLQDAVGMRVPWPPDARRRGAVGKRARARRCQMCGSVECPRRRRMRGAISLS